jgi:hypothetical protein
MTMNSKWNKVAATAASLALLAFTSSRAVFADEKRPLQGGVDETAPMEVAPNLAPMEPMAVPVVPPKVKKLQGAVEHIDKGSPLKANAEDDDEDAGALTPMQPQSDASKRMLKGTANAEGDRLTKEDPDSEDQELMVQWDKWRNKFLWAIQSSMQEELNNPGEADLRWDPQQQVMMARFPLGTTAWFTCRVTADRHIADFKLLRSSGYPNYDKAVINSVKSLEGSSILKFPNRSHRQIVTQIAGIKTSETSERQFQHFGDVERYSVPGQ